MKTTLYYLPLVCLIAWNCSKRDAKSEAKTGAEPPSNITPELVAGMTWMNKPQSFAIENGALTIPADKETDFFNNPEDSSVIGTAPYLYQKVEGDFVARALVEPDFSSQWNAVALMVYIDSLNWIKFAFENSDATGPSIVTVVTKGTSDDANGVILDNESKVWLAIARKGNIYSMHWSVDGRDFKMARLTSMTDQQVVSIGVEAQCPVGPSATHRIHYFDIEKRTVENLRNINGE